MGRRRGLTAGVWRDIVHHVVPGVNVSVELAVDLLEEGANRLRFLEPFIGLVRQVRGGSDTIAVPVGGMEPSVGVGWQQVGGGLSGRWRGLSLRLGRGSLDFGAGTGVGLIDGNEKAPDLLLALPQLGQPPGVLEGDVDAGGSLCRLRFGAGHPRECVLPDRLDAEGAVFQPLGEPDRLRRDQFGAGHDHPAPGHPLEPQLDTRVSEVTAEPRCDREATELAQRGGHSGASTDAVEATCELQAQPRAGVDAPLEAMVAHRHGEPVAMGVLTDRQCRVAGADDVGEAVTAAHRILGTGLEATAILLV